ncbi:MAG: EAL domain-containing protein [Rhodoferax sp.]|uniref:putative bifunctional diguanylate cyclase/phosphodiesterase n=1 Tax=Rhodoferax sp. TaxID=50421 RepID=UPI00261C0DF0|nr:EAL domain-containing protein [Rhodoferax sp.]MDD2882089.1 EAL domain-containing protein [Rhodoferax sp.]
MKQLSSELRCHQAARLTLVTNFMTMPINKPSAKPRILVVEDELLVARDICEQLVLLGYEPIGHTASGEEALLLAEQHHPDLVLMDIELAGAMDGIAAAQALRSKMCLPVVFLTAFDADDTLARAKLAEPYGYLLKPFSERELRTVLEMALYKCQAQTRLRESAERTQAILDNMADGVVTINTQGRIESCNPAACRIFGYAAQALIGHNVGILMPEQHRNQHDNYINHDQRNGPLHVIGVAREVEGLRKDGSHFPLSVTLSELQSSGQTTFIGMLRDLSLQQQNTREIHRLAFYDRLTGLPNRHWFKERVAQALANSARNGQYAALLLLDLDDFKHINDTQGLLAGDQLLKEAALRLKATVRASDALARIGGDEFVLLLPDLSDQMDAAANQAEASARHLLHILAQAYTLGEHPCQSTASIGIVVFSGAAQSVDDLLKQADIALYQAKGGGRNTLRFFDAAMQAAVLAHAEQLADLRRGLAANEFVLYYQPQVSRHGSITGAEALVRWQHPTRGLVPPGDFIVLAEDSKLILPLGQWVLVQACAQVRAWAVNPLTAHWTMAVNVSALQFAQPDFVDAVAAALQSTGANPACLKLELTESMLVRDVPAVIAKMKQIKALGVSFSLDDFGTGYSSLSYLKLLPLDQLKIDRSFVRDLLTDPNDKAIAHAVIALGHSLGLKVIAEGVETQEQRYMLAELHCDAFQGYLFGKPMPVELLTG